MKKAIAKKRVFTREELREVRDSLNTAFGYDSSSPERIKFSKSESDEAVTKMLIKRIESMIDSDTEIDENALTAVAAEFIQETGLLDGVAVDEDDDADEAPPKKTAKKESKKAKVIEDDDEEDDDSDDDDEEDAEEESDDEEDEDEDDDEDDADDEDDSEEEGSDDDGDEESDEEDSSVVTPSADAIETVVLAALNTFWENTMKPALFGAKKSEEAKEAKAPKVKAQSEVDPELQKALDKTKKRVERALATGVLKTVTARRRYIKDNEVLSKDKMKNLREYDMESLAKLILNSELKKSEAKFNSNK